MSKTFLTVFALSTLLPAVGQATGCPAEDGTEYPGLEGLNQTLLDGDYNAFTQGVLSGSGSIQLDMSSIAQIFPDGFDYCTTIAQRQETTGLTQNLVVFRASNGPLFLYWLVLPKEDGFTLHSVSLNTELGPVMDNFF